MTTLDLLFPVLGTTLPTDHVYNLYGALSRLLPWLHDPASRVALAPLTGRYVGHGELQLGPGSCLRLRLQAEDVPKVLSLAGRSLEAGGHTVRLGAPTVTPLEPAPMLAAQLVTFKHADEPARFLTVARQKLDELGVSGEVGVPFVQKGTRAEEPQRRVLRVKGYRIVGYSLLVAELTAEESVLLQERGLGGRARMGCGFFLPYGRRGS
jgi:CRISPR-associated protein Cas6